MKKNRMSNPQRNVHIFLKGEQIGFVHPPGMLVDFQKHNVDGLPFVLETNIISCNEISVSPDAIKLHCEHCGHTLAKEEQFDGCRMIVEENEMIKERYNNCSMIKYDDVTHAKSGFLIFKGVQFLFETKEEF